MSHMRWRCVLDCIYRTWVPFSHGLNKLKIIFLNTPIYNRMALYMWQHIDCKHVFQNLQRQVKINLVKYILFDHNLTLFYNWKMILLNENLYTVNSTITCFIKFLLYIWAEKGILPKDYHKKEIVFLLFCC